MPQITNGTVAFEQDYLDWFNEQYGGTEWAVYVAGIDEVYTHDKQGPGTDVLGDPFAKASAREYLAELNRRFGPGSPMDMGDPLYAVALHWGAPEIQSHEHSYPIQPPHGSFAKPGNCACGSPYADVESAQRREIAAVEWAVQVVGLGVLARPDNNPAYPLFTEETARQFAAWANAEMSWLPRNEANAAVVLHYGVPEASAGAK